MPTRPIILMYHRIAEEPFDPWGLAVTPAHFAEQLDWLANNRSVLGLGEFAARHAEGSLPDTAVAITFDDGYACAAEVAAPMLAALQMPATVFLPVDLIERGGAFWWDELQDLVLDAECPSLTVGASTIPLGERRADDRQWTPGSRAQTPRQHAFERLWAVIRPLPPERLFAAMAELRAQSRTQGRQAQTKPPMTPGKVRSCAGGPMVFGSHALTHPWLESLSRAEKAREILDSMARCQALTGSRPTAFAYPYGNFDPDSERLVQEAGFACACATTPRSVTRKSRLFALPRMQVGNWSSTQLARAMATLPA